MKPKTVVALAVATCSLLAGCDRPSPDYRAQTTAPAAAPEAPGTNVTAPARDPSLPPAEAGIQKPKTATDATKDTELTRTERDSAMPVPGQANDHSSPEFAKRGDGQAPAKAPN